MRINFSDEPFVYDERSIFLAGPTLRNSTFDKSWRKEACDILEKIIKFKGTVYVPEFKDSETPFDLTAQADWEREGLMNAKCILFYFCRYLPNLPGFTTNIEFGMYLAKRPKNIVLCIPKNAEKVDYVKWLYQKECPNEEITDSLIGALSIANKIAGAVRI